MVLGLSPTFGGGDENILAALTAAQQTQGRPATGGQTQLDPQTANLIGQAGGGIGQSLGGVIGGIALLSGAAGRGGKRFHKQGLEALQDVGLPEFDLSDIDAPTFRVLAERFPQLMESFVPDEAALIDDSIEGRAGQLEALLGTGEIAREGLTDADRLAAEQAGRAVRGALRGGEEAAVSQLRRRGRAGAGGELQSRIAGGRVASELARDLGSNLQQLALERRLGALGQQGQQAGQLRGADILGQSTNADAINRFREFASMQQQQAAMQNQMERARAADYNVGTTQRIGEQQQIADYETERQNIERQNQARNQGFLAENLRAANIANQYNTLATGAYNKQKAKAGQIQGVSQGIGGLVGGGIGLGGLL